MQLATRYLTGFALLGVGLMGHAYAQSPSGNDPTPQFALFDLGPVDMPGNIAGAALLQVQRTRYPIVGGVPASLATGVQWTSFQRSGPTLDGQPNSCDVFADFDFPPAYQFQGVGTCQFRQSPPEWHAVLWMGNQVTDLGILPNALSQFGVGAPNPGPTARAFNMNSAGDVVGGSDTGYAHTAAPPAYHAFLWNGGVMQDLGTLLDVYANSEAIAVNDSHEAVGWSDAVDSSNGLPRVHAFLYANGSMYDLNDLLVYAPPTSRLMLAEAISCNGDITALGYDTRVSDGSYTVHGGPREHAYFLAALRPPRDCPP